MGRQPFKSEKRRKELARLKKQELKRQKREERKLARQLNPDGTEILESPEDPTGEDQDAGQDDLPAGPSSEDS